MLRTKHQRAGPTCQAPRAQEGNFLAYFLRVFLEVCFFFGGGCRIKFGFRKNTGVQSGWEGRGNAPSTQHAGRSRVSRRGLPSALHILAAAIVHRPTDFGLTRYPERYYLGTAYLDAHTAGDRMGCQGTV